MRQIDWPSWEKINRLGAALGVSEFARDKWRQRGVPHKWRLPMIERAKAQRIALDPTEFIPPAPADAPAKETV